MTLIISLKTSNNLKEYTFTKDLIIAGRTQTNDLVIDDPTVSRHHFKITRENNNFYIEDLNSTNGTYVNGLKIKKSILKDGDVISVSHYKMDVKITKILIPNAYLSVIKNPYDERKFFKINRIITFIGTHRVHIPAKPKHHFFPLSDFSSAIVFKDINFVLIPLNPSFVKYNDSPISLKQILSDGDKIEVGSTLFEFKIQN